jgi:hypothetical protein
LLKSPEVANPILFCKNNNVFDKSQILSQLAQKLEAQQKEIEDLKKKTLTNQEIDVKDKSKQLLESYLKSNNLSNNEFKKQYGDEFVVTIKKYMQKGIAQDEATEIALLKIKREQVEEVPFEIPKGGSTREKSKTIRLTQKQVELAKKCGNDPIRVYQK